MDATEQLCRDVGREVMGLPEFVRGLYVGEAPVRSLALTGDDVLRVVEAMYDRNLYCDIKTNDPEVIASAPTLRKYEVNVWGVADDGSPTDLRGVGRADSMPEAMFRAALQAVRQENDNG